MEFDIGIALGRLTIIQRGGLAVDLDLTLDLISCVVSDNLQRVGFELLVHHQLVGGESAEIGRNAVDGIRLGQFPLDRQTQRDHGGNRSLARIGIDQSAGKFAEALGSKNFGHCRYRTIDPEFHLGRRWLRRHVRHFEYEIGDSELAPGGRI